MMWLARPCAPLPPLEKDMQAQLNDLDKKGAAKLVGKLVG